MKRYFKSGYNYIQDVILNPGTYTFWAYIKSEFGDTFTFALANEAGEWELFDVDVEMGKWTRAYEVFTITEKKVKLDLIHRYYDSQQPVYVLLPQKIKGNIPSDAGASPFDIDQITDDLHDQISGIEDFTNIPFADRVLNSGERVSLKRNLEGVESIFQSLKGSYENLLVNIYIPSATLTALTAKYNAVVLTKNNLFDVLNLIIAGDDIVTPEEIAAKDNAFTALNNALFEYNQAEKEIQKALAEDYTQKIAAIRDFTDIPFADRMLSETEKKNLSHDMDNIQVTTIDSITARVDELLLNVNITQADKDQLVLDYNALLDAWDWDYDIDPSKSDGLKTVILNIINGDNIVTPAEIAEKDLALSAFNDALSAYSTTETRISKALKGKDAPLLFIDPIAADMHIKADGTLPVQNIDFYAKMQNVTGNATWSAVPYIDNVAQTAITLTAVAGDENHKQLLSTSWNTAWTELKITATLGSLTYTSTIKPKKDGANGEGILDVVDWYAVSTDGVNPPGTGWTTTVPTKPANYYLWNYEVITYTDSRTPTQTKKNVIAGKDARSIYDIKNAYAYSSSDTVAPISGWQYSIAELGAKPAGYFLWVREDIAYTDNPSNYIGTIGYVVRDGDPGEDGDGIVSTTIEYAKSTSGTAAPSTGWSISLPSPSSGWYLWTRTTTTYKKSASTVAYSVSRYAKDGEPGGPGKGVSSVVVWYYKSSSATQLQGGSWSTTKPDYSTSFYLWTKVVTTYTDNSVTETTPAMDPDWHKVQAITDKFGTTSDGGLIQTVMMLLREANTLDVTAGISGIQGALKNNPASWAGGTYSQAFALIEFLSKMSAGTAPAAGEYDNLAKVTTLHNGAAKIGDFIVEESGRIVMVDPETGLPRLVFSVQDIPTITDLMSSTVFGEKIDVDAGSVSINSWSQILSNSTEITQDSSKVTFGGTTIYIAGTGRKQDNGMASVATVSIYARRNGVRYSCLASESIQFVSSSGSDESIQTNIPLTHRTFSKGTYDIELVLDVGGNVTNVEGSSYATTFEWTFTQQNVRRQQYGKDGMMFFYSDRHFHYTEGKGLDLRGPTNMPGVLLSASVGVNGGWQDVWGPKQSSTPPPTPSPTGRYTINHTIGHTKYQVSCFSNTENRSFRIYAKNTDSVVIECRTIGSNPVLTNSPFDITLYGNNYK